jgi:glutamyl-tRNA synthetase
MSKDIYLTWIKEYVDDSLNVLQDKLDQVLLLFKDQISYAREINNLIIKNFLSTQINKETLTTAINVVDRNTFIKCIKALKEVLSLYTEITLSNADNIVLDVKSKTDLDKKALYFPLRFVAIAKEHGPQMNMLFYVVGKIQLLKNIDMTLSLLNAK